MTSKLCKAVSQASQAPISTDPPTTFFAMTFVLALPFYVLGALAFLDVLGEPGIGPIYIGLFTVTPIASASLLTFRQHGRDGLNRLLWRIFDIKRIGDYRWYGAIILLPFLLSLMTLGGLVLSGERLPDAMLPFAALPMVLPFLFVLAALEEVGWMGHAFEPMQAQYGALQAALTLGLIWALWHVPFFIFLMPDPIVFSAMLITLVSMRVLIVWIFNNTGKSVFAAIVFHATNNALMITLADTNTTGALQSVISCGLMLSAAVVVAFFWGPQTLARYRFSQPHG